MPDKSLADKLLLWGTLGEGMKSRPEELAYLEEQRRELVARLEQVEALMTEQNSYEGGAAGARRGAGHLGLEIRRAGPPAPGRPCTSALADSTTAPAR